MMTTNEKATATVLLCGSDPDVLREYIEDHLNQWDEPMRMEMYRRLATLQGHFNNIKGK